jgi:hypothetical protein
MWLYTSFDPLQSSSGACAAAYAQLRQAGHNPTIIYVSTKDREATLMRLTGQTQLPVVITDRSEVVAPGEILRRTAASSEGTATGQSA